MNISSLLQQIGAFQPQKPGTNQGMGGGAFAALSGALTSGNLPGAQKALTDMKQLLISAGSIGAANSLKNDFDALGKAIGSGDASAARTSLAQLARDAQAGLGAETSRKPPPHGGLQKLLGSGRTLAGFAM